MAYYFSNCGGDGALLLDTATGATPADFDNPGTFIEITRDRYEELLADQCAGYCIKDAGNGEPTTEAQEMSSCTCIRYPQAVHTSGVMSSDDFRLDADGGIEIEGDGFAVNMYSSGMEVIRDPWGEREGYEFTTSSGRQNTGNDQDFSNSKPTLQPLSDYGMDLGSTNNCWEIIHCKGIKAYGTIDANKLKISGNPLADTVARILTGDFSFGAVGTIGLFAYTATTNANYLAPGNTVSGSNLKYAAFRFSGSNLIYVDYASYASGTWTVLHALSYNSGETSLVLAVRTA